MVPFIIAPAGFVVSLRHHHFAVDQPAHDRFLVGLAAAIFGERLRRNVETARLLHQQFADDQRARRLLPGGDRLSGRMVLHFPDDFVSRNGDAVDDDIDRASGGQLCMNRTAHRGYSAETVRAGRRP